MPGSRRAPDSFHRGARMIGVSREQPACPWPVRVLSWDYVYVVKRSSHETQLHFWNVRESRALVSVTDQGTVLRLLEPTCEW